MKSLKILVSIVLINLLFSCTNESVDKSKTEISLGDLMKTLPTNFSSLNSVVISSSSVGSTLAQVNVQSVFKNNKYAAIKIDNDVIEGTEGVKTFSYLNPGFEKWSSKFGRDIGFTINKEIENGRTEAVGISLYAPQLLILNLDELLEFSKSKDLKINWNKDNVNSKPYVTIMLVARQLENGDFIKENIRIQKTVNDNGTVTIDKSELQKFCTNCRLGITLLRGNYSIVDDLAVAAININSTVSTARE
jgi:hypothetical protein